VTGTFFFRSAVVVGPVLPSGAVVSVAFEEPALPQATARSAMTAQVATIRKRIGAPRRNIASIT
jgi:hypothetical protein